MCRAWTYAILAVVAQLGIATHAFAQAQPPAPRWAVDSRYPGPDTPPAGRSLFDFFASTTVGGKRVYDLPYPYEALIKRLEAQAGCTAQAECVKQVLIPLGRSLQRPAASPDFFKYPRIVAVVDKEGTGATGPLLKDRIYLGYQEKTNVIEAISYNETAGRFEFQLVNDYRLGGTPQVSYARRALCAACHQNLSPIFSRQLWQETNANPRIAALLTQEQLVYHGVPVRRGVDFPDAIDAATDRANLFGVWQRLWRDGCGANGASATRCRAALFIAALQYRLTDGRAFDENAIGWREAVLPVLTNEWRARWPGGLAIPNPDLPNRNPLPAEGATLPRGVALTNVAAAFEPLTPREPLEVWTAVQPENMRRLVAGLADFIAAKDAQTLDQQLITQAPRNKSNHRSYEAQCDTTWTTEWLRFQCTPIDESAAIAARFSGRINFKGGRASDGELSAIALGGAQPLQRFDIAAPVFSKSGSLRFTPKSQGRRARLADGNAIATIELRWPGSEIRVNGSMHTVTAHAVVDVIEDFAAVGEAVNALVVDDMSEQSSEQDVFSAQPFSRARVVYALFARLGLAQSCCDDVARLPPIVVEAPEPEAPSAGPAKNFAAFYPLCATCHATNTRFPPNFLNGSGEHVAAALKHCAPRIYTRLAMWRLAADARDKTPMPPPFPSTSASAYHAPGGIEGLERSVAELIRTEFGTVPSIDQLLANGYEALRPCLPEQP